MRGGYPLHRRGRRKGRRSLRFTPSGHRGISGQSRGQPWRSTKGRSLPLRVRAAEVARLRGSTGCKNKREAQEFERAKRQEKAKEAERREALGRDPLTWAVAAARYWDELGQHHRRATTPALARMAHPNRRRYAAQRHRRRLVARLVAQRRGEGVSRHGQPYPDGTPARRTEPREALGRGPAPIEFRKHMLPQPRERVRELRADEEAALFAALRPDYHPLVRFALLTGCRLPRVRRG